MGLFIFAALIVIGNFLGAKFGTVAVDNFSFTLGLFVSVPLFVLRDILQEQGKGMKPFFAALPAFALVYLTNLYYIDDPLRRTSAVVIAIFWTLLIDRIIFTYFRRFGWMLAMLVSDLISIPVVTILFFYLYIGGWSVPDGQLILKYLTLFLVYVILLMMGWGSRAFHGEPFRKVPRREWFRYYDKI